MGYSIFLLLVTVGLLCGSGAENPTEIKEMKTTIKQLQGMAYFINNDMSQTSLDDVYA